MPETATVAERPVIKEKPQASNGLMLHIAHGEFDSSKTAALDKNPTEINKKTFDILQERHNSAQMSQKETYYAHVKKRFIEDLGWPEDKITPDILRHVHMKDWALTESIRMRALLAHTRTKNPAQFDRMIAAFNKLHISVNPNSSTFLTQDQFYVVDPDSEISGKPAEFYKTFCEDGTIIKKLIDTLTQPDIVVLQPFLVDTLGSETAYQALLATKQTQDAIAAKHDFTGNASALSLSEYAILEFFRHGTVSPPLEEDEEKLQEASVLLQRVDGGYTVANPEHPDRNDDISFLDTAKMRGGIFDGAGGYTGSDEAGRVAMTAIQEILNLFPSQDFLEMPMREQFIKAFTLANERVKALGSGMTTAAVFQVVRGRESGQPKLLVGNIGDSRVWIRHKDGTITQVTRDGSQLRSLHLKSLGDIPESSDPRFQEERDGQVQYYESLQAILDNARSDADFAKDPRLKAVWQIRNQTNLLGDDDFKKGFEFFESPLEEGDTIFMTTDGVHDNLTQQEITEIAKNTADADALSKQLVAKARGIADTKGRSRERFRAKPDDITAVACTLPHKELGKLEK